MKFLFFFICSLIYLSSHAQQEWKMHTIDDTSFGADGTKVYDVNRDGYLDIISGWEQGNVARLYLNPQQVDQDWPFIEVPAPQVEDALVVDLDEDGFADIVTLSEGEHQRITFHWAPADEAKYSESKYWQSADVPSTLGRTAWMFGIALDVDGKNGTDLVVGSKNPNAGLGWLEAPADSRDVAAWQYHEICPAGWIMSIIAQDMNGDGLEDIVISDRRGEQRGVRWLENPGAGDHLKGAWKNHTIGLADGEPMFLTIKDKSIYISGLNTSMLHFQSTAENQWQADTLVYPTMAGSRGKAVAIGDLNLDGTDDIVLSFEGAENKHGVIWRDGATQQFHPLSDKQGSKYDLLVLLDMDQDGDLDVLTSEENNNSATQGGLGVVWYENPLH